MSRRLCDTCAVRRRVEVSEENDRRIDIRTNGDGTEETSGTKKKKKDEGETRVTFQEFFCQFTIINKKGVFDVLYSVRNGIN